MKTGCCTNLIATGSDRIGFEVAENLIAVGYEYIELPLAQIMELSDEMFDNLKQKILSQGINIEACNNFFPSSIRLTGSEVNYKKIMEYSDKAFFRAKELGARIIVFGSAGARNVPEEFSYRKAQEQIFTLLKKLSELARKYDHTIVVEHLTRQESNIINSVSEALELVRSIERDNIKLLIDYYHMIIENENPEIILQTRNYVRHIHFCEPKGRVFPTFLNPDYEVFFKYLNSIQYNERISIEAFSSNYMADAKVSLGVLRSFNEKITTKYS